MPTEIDVNVALAPIPIPASVYVACPATWCPSFGIQRLIYLPRPALGIVALPQLFCQACHCVIGIPMPSHIEEEDVPKLHVHRDPTYRDQIAQTAAEPAPAELVADVAPAEVADAVEAPEAAKAAPRKTQPRKKAS